MDRVERTLIEELREKIASDRFEFSKHAVDQSIVRRISVQELRETVEGGEVIEDYPVITLYEPEPERWIDFKRRRPE